jgi:hypothetical protein
MANVLNIKAAVEHTVCNVMIPVLWASSNLWCLLLRCLIGDTPVCVRFCRSSHFILLLCCAVLLQMLDVLASVVHDDYDLEPPLAAKPRA